MSFLYPHKLTIKRPHTVVTVGDRGYSAPRPATEDTLFLDLQCSIQEFVNAGRSPVGLPSDAKVQSQWRIMLQRRFPDGTFKSGDIGYDAQGNRYHIWLAAPTSLGYELGAVMLEK